MKFKIKGEIFNSPHDQYRILVTNSTTKSVLKTINIDTPNDPRKQAERKLYKGHWFMNHPELVDVELYDRNSGVRVATRLFCEPKGIDYDDDAFLEVDFTL
jgi:hypothetical protein